MSDQVIQRAAELMREQAAAYRRLNSLCEQLTVALVRGEAEQIEAMTRTSEAELLSLRARLAQITSTLSSFAAARAAGPNQLPISAEVRTTFESASNDLIAMARTFQRLELFSTLSAADNVRVGLEASERSVRRAAATTPGLSRVFQMGITLFAMP